MEAGKGNENPEIANLKAQVSYLKSKMGEMKEAEETKEN